MNEKELYAGVTYGEAEEIPEKAETFRMDYSQYITKGDQYVLKEEGTSAELSLNRVTLDQTQTMMIRPECVANECNNLTVTQTLKQGCGTCYHERKGRVVNRTIAVLPNGYVNYETVFSSGIVTSDLFMTNARGEICWYRLRYYGQNSDSDMIGIWFKGTNHGVVFDPADVDAKKLLKAFCSAGIKFTHFLKEAEMARLLFDFFYYGRPELLSELWLPYRAGWMNGKFHNKDSLGKFKPFFDKNAPILLSSFSTQKLSMHILKMYFQEIRGIAFWKDRLVVMLFPLVAMISSLIPVHMRKEGHALNIVLTEGAQISRISTWFQVFNRYSEKYLCINEMERVIESRMHNLQDDVLIVDAFMDETETPYRKNEAVRKATRIMLSVNGTLRNVAGSCVIVSDCLLLGSKAYRLVISEDFEPGCTVEMLMQEKVFEAVQCEFIRYVSLKLQSQNGVLFSSDGDASTPFVFCFDALKKIAKAFGCDLFKEAEIDREADVRQLLEDDCSGGEEWPQLFVREFRKFAGNVFFKHKKSPDIMERCVLYDSDHLWVPESVLELFLKNMGMTMYKERMLIQLKEMKLLKTEGRGFKVRLQSGGNRQGYYKFCRSCFEPEGMIDLVSLGKEETENDS